MDIAKVGHCNLVRWNQCCLERSCSFEKELVIYLSILTYRILIYIPDRTRISTTFNLLMSTADISQKQCKLINVLVWHIHEHWLRFSLPKLYSQYGTQRLPLLPINVLQRLRYVFISKELLKTYLTDYPNVMCETNHGSELYLSRFRSKKYWSRCGR